MLKTLICPPVLRTRSVLAAYFSVRFSRFDTRVAKQMTGDDASDGSRRDDNLK